MEPLPHLQSPQVDMGAAFLDWRSWYMNEGA